MRWLTPERMGEPPAIDATPGGEGCDRRGLRAEGTECIKVGTKREHIYEAAVETRCELPDSLEKLLALEQELEREWWWLHGALNAVAEVQAERTGGIVTRFRGMQAQVAEVDRRRVQIAMRLAELDAGGAQRDRERGLKDRQ